MTFPEKPYFSLEDPDIRMAAEADPRGFLDRMREGGDLDEVQRLPGWRVLGHRPGRESLRPLWTEHA
jgi:hypothetical protein